MVLELRLIILEDESPGNAETVKEYVNVASEQGFGYVKVNSANV